MNQRITACAAGIAITIASTTPVLLLGLAEPVAAEGIDEQITEVIVWLERERGSVADIDAVAAEHGVTVLDTLVASKGIHLIAASGELKESEIKKLFKKDDRVRYAEPNYEGANVDSDRFHAWPNGLPDVVGDDTQSGRAQDLRRVHELATGADTIVAILDTGVDNDHDALQGHLLEGWDFVDDDADPDDEAMNLDRDGNGLVDEAWGHGTHVAGIVAQVAPDAQLVPYRVLDSEGIGRAFAVAAAIFDAVDRGADVINLSFGLDHKSRSKVLKDAMKYAKDHDVIVIAAAGNAGDDRKRYPAAEKDVISVSAADEAQQALAIFANYGGWVDIGAPGVSILSALPNGQFGLWSGSSMAAPFVAGQAALLLEYAPEEKVNKISNTIRKSSRKPSHGPKLKYGIIDLQSSLDELAPK